MGRRVNERLVCYLPRRTSVFRLIAKLHPHTSFKQSYTQLPKYQATACNPAAQASPYLTAPQGENIVTRSSRSVPLGVTQSLEQRALFSLIPFPFGTTCRWEVTEQLHPWPVSVVFSDGFIGNSLQDMAEISPF